MPDSNITSWAWSFGDPSWAWSFGDPANGGSSQKNPQYIYSPAGDYSVSLTTTSNFGCSNSFQKSVTIHPSPKADFSFGPACVNQSTQFNDLSSGAIKSWLWSIQGTAYAIPNPVHTFKSASNYTAQLTVTGTNNCINQLTKNVLVPVPIIPDFTSRATCATNVAVFDEITQGGADPAASWSWNFANQGSGDTSPAQHVFASVGNYSVTLNTTRLSGCTYSVTKSIPITAPPKAQFTVSQQSGGAPLNVDFTNTSLRATSYEWDFDDATPPVNEFSPSHTFLQEGDYNTLLTVRDALGCTDSESFLISVLTPQINAAMKDFRLVNIPGSNNYSPVVTIENKSNVTLNNPDVYLDLSGGGLISEKIIGVIKPGQSLSYEFKASLAPRSLAFACAEVKVTADDYAFDNRQCVNLLDEYVSRVPYPNPANDELILEWINNSSEPMEVIIYNAAGQVVISREYTSTVKGLNQVKVDVSKLSMGIYFVSYTIDHQTQNFRFSIVR